jgi:SpoVK/Ycf46/Vps4 family AAA+-type ATPase
MRRALAWKHLTLRLRPINRLLRDAVAQQAQIAARLARPELTHLCITDDHVALLLDEADAWLESPDALTIAASNTDIEPEADQPELVQLRAHAASLAFELPLDALARVQQLSPFEMQALLLCAAPAIDRSYERMYGYILDDMTRRQPCIELLTMLGAASRRERVGRRFALGPYGVMRRTGLLKSSGEAPNELRQELKLGEDTLALLCGAGSVDAFRDPASVNIALLADGSDASRKIARLGKGLHDGTIALVGVWGPARADHADVVRGLAYAAGRALRRYTADLSDANALRQAIDAAAALNAILWIPVDALAENADSALRERLTQALSTSRAPIVLSGITAWRPAALLAARAYADLPIAVPSYDARQQLWAAALSSPPASRLAELAARYRIGATEVRAIALTAQSAAHLAGGDEAVDVTEHVNAACAAVLRPASQRLVTVIEPRRGRDDLILPPALHQQVLEVASFFRAWPKVSDGWGFGRLSTGSGGIKALFTGASGTGKTLAAEVVAGELGMPLLRIDLSQIVSKWIGETEKHLEAVFAEAEDSHGVLFFDEADALFGKRGEVQHGVDRYANLEVSYLLQRIEDYAGLVILASNLKDNIDAAFTRRFQVVIQFPKPQQRERRRIWERAFPLPESLEHDLDLDVLSRLDLTGAGITNAARTAALLAVAEGRDVIGKSHVVIAIVRQYQLEARVLVASELGAYAPLMRDVEVR